MMETTYGNNSREWPNWEGVSSIWWLEVESSPGRQTTAILLLLDDNLLRLLLLILHWWAYGGLVNRQSAPCAYLLTLLIVALRGRPLIIGLLRVLRLAIALRGPLVVISLVGHDEIGREEMQWQMRCVR